MDFLPLLSPIALSYNVTDKAQISYGNILICALMLLLPVPKTKPLSRHLTCI